MKPNMIQTDNILNGCVISLIKPPGQSEQIIRANISVSEINVLLRASK